MRKTMNHHDCNRMIKLYTEVLDITDNGGLAYETPSAVWTYDPTIERVTLYVKEPSEMTNTILDYTKHNRNFKTHRDRILRLTGAKPTAYRMTK